MADVDMADAPPSEAVVKKKGGPSTSAGNAVEPRKRFEVKKVR